MVVEVYAYQTAGHSRRKNRTGHVQNSNCQMTWPPFLVFGAFAQISPVAFHGMERRKGPTAVIPAVPQEALFSGGLPRSSYASLRSGFFSGFKIDDTPVDNTVTDVDASGEVSPVCHRAKMLPADAEYRGA